MPHDYQQKIASIEIISLSEAGKKPEAVTKVGVLPFVPSGEPQQWHVMMMKPKSEKGHPGKEPEFQIAKGTRRINVGGGWCDMRDDDLVNADPSFHEPLLVTALREGEEEIGLRSQNITRMFDLGVHSIVSARKGVTKRMHLFAAEIKDKKDFGAFEAKTAQVKWLTVEEFLLGGRPDHVGILRESVALLGGYYKGA